MMRNTRATQRGVGALALSLILLFGTSIVVFYLNRGMIFEQKTSANQVRSTTALEAAEAGLEWATGMLNRPYDIQSNCTFNTTTNISFRKKYIQTMYSDATNPTPNVVPATTVFPGCYMDTANSGALSCGCPDVPASGTATASLSPTTAMPGFTVSFAAVTGDTESVRVTSVGCNAASGACTSTTASSSDATATVTVILKMRRILRAAPAAALTCGSSCGISGSFNVVNYDASTNGITVNAGTTTSGTSGAVGTIPGIPPQNSIISSDSSLSALSSAGCTNDKVFNAYFGSTMSEYANSPATKTITCTSASDCGSQLNTAYNDGWRSFYFTAPNGLALNSSATFSQLGTDNDPVTIVTAGPININATMDIYGLLFSNDATAGDLGTGSATVHGALVACSAFTSNGNGAVVYDGKALKNLQLNTSVMVRVPGSWRDW